MSNQIPKLRALLAIANKEARQMVAFSIESRLPVVTVEAKSAKEAVGLIEGPEKFDLAICEYPGIGDAFFKHMASIDRKDTELSKLPCIVLATRPISPKNPILALLNIVARVNLASAVESLFPVIEKLVQSEKFEDSEFCRIHTNLLIRVGPLAADIYIRLSSTKYLKLFREGDRFDDVDYRRYLVEKKLEYLYLRTSDCAEFISKFKFELLKLLQTQFQDTAESLEVSETVHETIQELVQKIGPSKEVQDLVKSSVQLTMKTIAKSRGLQDLLARIQADKTRYLASHSFLLSSVASVVAAGMEWGSEVTLFKLNLAALLHDIPIMNQALASVQTLAELEARKEEFTEEECKAFKMHPIAGAEIAKRFHEVPPDVDTIIIQHHEQPDGSGFPRGLSQSYISPLGAVFIAAHDLVSAVFASEGAFRMEEFLEARAQKYGSGNFRKILKALATVSQVGTGG
jgi:HD-GYP domain-containing protein (c-di-GMP phosphodiesterase class II)